MESPDRPTVLEFLAVLFCAAALLLMAVMG